MGYLEFSSGTQWYHFISTLLSLVSYGALLQIRMLFKDLQQGCQLDLTLEWVVHSSAFRYAVFCVWPRLDMMPWPALHCALQILQRELSASSFKKWSYIGKGDVGQFSSSVLHLFLLNTLSSHHLSPLHLLHKFSYLIFFISSLHFLFHGVIRSTG